MSYQPPNHTESSILQSYLLPPTPLPTVLPYTSFLKVVPAKYTSDPSYSRVLKRLYRDLQLQRDLDIETVRANIERECSKGSTLQATLARLIANENDHAVRKGRTSTKKRKRSAYDIDGEHENVDVDASDLGSDSAIGMHVDEDEDVLGVDTDDELQHESAVEFAFAKHALNAHPSTDLMPVPTSAQSASRKLHTSSSLLEAMQNANDSLLRENEGLEEMCKRQLVELEDIVGGLSDLRYGTFSGKSSDGEDKVGELAEAIGGLREMLSTKIRGRGTTTGQSLIE